MLKEAGFFILAGDGFSTEFEKRKKIFFSLSGYEDEKKEIVSDIDREIHECLTKR